MSLPNKLLAQTSMNHLGPVVRLNRPALGSFFVRLRREWIELVLLSRLFQRSAVMLGS